MFCFGIFRTKAINTSLIDAFVPAQTGKFEIIRNLANKSSNKLNVIFEADDKDTLEQIVESFSEEISALKEPLDVESILNIYKNYPTNFLSKDYQKLIQNKKYSELASKSKELLYNPISYYVLPPDKDPFLLTTNYVLSNKKSSASDIVSVNNKFYLGLNLSVKNEDVKKLYALQNKYNKRDGAKVYLTGTPIHSYITTEKSKLEINIFCTFATLALLFLCYKFFRSIKVLIPISLSILYGFFVGYSISTLFFNSIHILTFVFSTSLIGISLDYSLHYLFGNKNNEFKKSLTLSMLTTVFTFSMLYFSKIEILQQIAVFTTSGLIGTYLFVLFVLPLFKISCVLKEIKSIKVPNSIKFFIIAGIVVVSATGCYGLKFNDNIQSLYSPPKKLLYAEKINKEVFGSNTPAVALIQGESIDEILEKEEKLGQILDKDGSEYVALSKYISSTKQQKLNSNLIMTLYKEFLNEYAKFLDIKIIEQLKKQPQKIYNVSEFPLTSEFLLSDNTSFMLIYNKSQNVKISTLDIPTELSKISKSIRIKCLKLLPIVFSCLFIFLVIYCGFKKTLKIVTPSLLGTLFALGTISLFGMPLNLFHILGLFLIIGFSLDYSIFKVNGGKNSNSAVFISAISTAFSFMLLSFTSFKLISSLGMVLCVGIITSYILSLLLLDDARENI